MRFLLLSALILVATALHAQNLQLGINGGFAFNTVPTMGHIPYGATNVK